MEGHILWKTCLWKQILMIVYACMCEQMLDCEYVIALRLCVGATCSRRSLANLSNVCAKFKPLSEITVHPFDNVRVGCLRRVRWVCITLCLCPLWSVASEEGDGMATPTLALVLTLREEKLTYKLGEGNTFAK